MNNFTVADRTPKLSRNGFVVKELRDESKSLPWLTQSIRRVTSPIWMFY